MTINEFIAKYGIQMVAVSQGDDLSEALQPFGQPGKRWECVFTFGWVNGQPPPPKGTFLCDETQPEGMVWAPTAGGVLARLAGDARTVLSVHSFEEWAEELGVNLDSRQEERAYRAVRAQTRRLKAWLGAKAFKELLACEDAFADERAENQ